MKISAAMQPSELGDVNIFSIFVDFDFFTISSFQEFFSECSPFLPRTTYKTNKRRKTISFPRRSHKSQPYYSLAQPKQGVYKNKRRKLCIRDLNQSYKLISRFNSIYYLCAQFSLIISSSRRWTYGHVNGRTKYSVEVALQLEC